MISGETVQQKMYGTSGRCVSHRRCQFTIRKGDRTPSDCEGNVQWIRVTADNFYLKICCITKQSINGAFMLLVCIQLIKIFYYRSRENLRAHFVILYKPTVNKHFIFLYYKIEFQYNVWKIWIHTRYNVHPI